VPTVKPVVLSTKVICLKPHLEYPSFGRQTVLIESGMSDLIVMVVLPPLLKTLMLVLPETKAVEGGLVK